MTHLRLAFHVIAASIVAFSIVIMVTMDAGSASTGGRFFVAVAAVVLLGAVDTQFQRLLHRHLPFHIGTHPQERRWAAQSLLLLPGVGVLLLGLAYYLFRAGA